MRKRRDSALRRQLPAERAYDKLIKRIVGLRREGLTMERIASQINREGYRTPVSQTGYTAMSVRRLLARCGLTKDKIGTRELGAKSFLGAIARTAKTA